MRSRSREFAPMASKLYLYIIYITIYRTNLTRKANYKTNFADYPKGSFRKGNPNLKLNQSINYTIPLPDYFSTEKITKLFKISNVIDSYTYLEEEDAKTPHSLSFIIQIDWLDFAEVAKDLNLTNECMGPHNPKQTTGLDVISSLDGFIVREEAPAASNNNLADCVFKRVVIAFVT